MSDYDFKWDDLSDGEKVKTRASISEQLARSRYKDYAATVKPAVERINSDDDFRKELYDAEDPAELLYQTGKAMSPPSLEEILKKED
ncbi:MAG: hypothetical protein B6D76_03535 [gamma proteobacterium symbiont of Stewartia floridana]|nr:MAG: hypothetical protein B6D76_03535 [gamma proteobacterium symbiont of Stewartia floridana]RLW58999.1 MAG: hypothetical protein B6D75_12025 [gamma proteobacterium symbiont of Stewartia floridana]